MTPPNDQRAGLILGLDLGGTKSAATVGTQTGEILYRVSGPTPAQSGAEGVVPFLLELLRDAHAHAPDDEFIAGVGVSAGAPCDAKMGRVFSAPNLPGWDNWGGDAPAGVPLAQIVSDALGGLPTFLENDADATALAEHCWGAGQNTSDMAFLTWGTGVGSGLVINGQLCRGADKAGGEIGHIAIVPDGRPCLCGLRGCLEAYASGPSIARVAIENGWVGEPTGQAVINGARNGDKAALFAVEQAGKVMGRGLATLCMITNPRRIVLGTLAVHAGDLLLPLVWQSFRAHAWPRLHQNVEIVPAALGDKAQDLAALCAFLQGSPAAQNGTMSRRNQTAANENF